MVSSFDPEAVARHIAAAHENREAYANLPSEIAPATVADAYAAQDALVRLLAGRLGGVAGLKIATTTRVMQEMMGIDHPCGGNIFANTVHASPARIRLSDHIHLMIECELAVRIGRELPTRGRPYTSDSVKAAIAAVMPAFELIEDRNADYKSCNALSLIADNCWNAGVVLGAEMPWEGSLAGIRGTLEIDGQPSREGSTDDPLGALAWIANLAAERGRPLAPGMVVITGSVIPTLPIRSGDTFAFRLDGLGATSLTAV